MGKRRKQRGGLGLLPFSDNTAFFEFVNQVVAPEVGKMGKKLQKRRRRQRGRGYIPGLGFLGFSTGRGSGTGIKKDVDFIGNLTKAYLLPKLRKRRRR